MIIFTPLSAFFKDISLSMEGIEYQDRGKNYEEKGHWWYVGRKKILLQLINFFFRKRPLKILDVGCGTGEMMKALSVFGDVKGVEIYKPLVEYSKAIGLDVSEGGIGELPFNEKFDIVTLLDVLEHIEDDSIVKNLSNYLKPDGLLFITVPALPLLWGPSDIYSKHYRRYCRNDLKKKLEKFGFDVQKISYFNSLLFPLIFFTKLFLRMYSKILRIKPSDSDLRILFFKPINFICKKLLESEAWCLKYFNFPIGTSLIAVVKNKSF
jgi:SAM-dependent methyltransferase